MLHAGTVCLILYLTMFKLSNNSSWIAESGFSDVHGDTVVFVVMLFNVFIDNA